MDANRVKIKEDLLSDKIDYSEAFELLKRLPKPWHSKEWKKKREQFIKSNCEQCGINKAYKPMYVQHLVQPPKFKDIRNTLFEQKFEQHCSKEDINFSQPTITDEEYKKYLKKHVEIREVCPNCLKQSISVRKTMKPKYRCSGCWSEFNEPETIEYIPDLQMRPNEDDVRERLNIKASNQRYYDLKQKLWNSWEQDLGKLALVISMEHSETYYDLVNAVTFCKTCAATMDRANRLLCYSCKENYFDYRLYSVCYQCHLEGNSECNPFASIVYRGEYFNQFGGIDEGQLS
ncbi:hypothetical protein [Acidiluteibacter ferrifornacis]|uniref:Uncharacterized protein n=1 Tax=Acidiluteibacter ferrifornacis TaxID=2692424 RepID=A0A6N9NJX9_9FLAO|nr:hypothetical protein [Acidiluteibacter ferrifornacis]NBG65500.1 hypothetical protein [Acidiluteibacter ferrifornacis]